MVAISVVGVSVQEPLALVCEREVRFVQIRDFKSRLQGDFRCRIGQRRKPHGFNARGNSSEKPLHGNLLYGDRDGSQAQDIVRKT